MQGFPFDSVVSFDEHGYPIYDRAVSSKPLKSLIAKLFTTGVMPNPSNNLQVFAGVSGLTVTVKAGFCVIEGGLKLCEDDTTLELNAADTTYDRIDTIVMRWDGNDNTRVCDLYVLTGTPAASPVRPDLTRVGSVYEIGLADILIPKNTSIVAQQNITDTRMDTARCGIVSSISEFDTTTLYEQVQADLEEFKDVEQADFEAWYEAIKDRIDAITAEVLQEQIDDIDDNIEAIVNVYGSKNLNSYPYFDYTFTQNGITFTDLGDGRVFVGDENQAQTATADVYFSMHKRLGATDFLKNPLILQNGKYILSGCPDGGGSSTYQIEAHKFKNNSTVTLAIDTGNGIEFTLADGDDSSSNSAYISLRIAIKNGMTIPAGGLIFAPMIRDARISDDTYVSYAMTNRELTEKKVKCAYINVPSKSISASATENFPLASLMPSDFHKLLAIIPIHVGPDSWGSTVPAVFSGIDLIDNKVSIRAYVSGNYSPKVEILYI